MTKSSQNSRIETNFPLLTRPPLPSNCGFSLKQKTAVFIDGGNLYKRLKSFGIKRTGLFDYNGLIKHLTKESIPVHIGYYVGQIKKEKGNGKSIVLHNGQQKLFSHLTSTVPTIKIVRGRIQNFQGTYKEKGVDVRLALDIYRLANENIYDKAIIISSDTDLIPAIELVEKMEGKTAEYIGFANNPSFGLIEKCNSKQLLKFNDVKTFEKH